MEYKEMLILELKAMFASCISNSFNTAMVWVTTSVKDYLCDSFFQTGFCNDLTHPLCYFLKQYSLKGSGPSFSKRKFKNE